MTAAPILDAYHGTHVATPQAGAERVEWARAADRVARVRVREVTCSCRWPIFELCAAGGLAFVRYVSLDDDGSISTLESPWGPAREAARLWTRILNGRAR
ncbi:hypothetical protein HII36_33050 [Nonomuraea sp. NN258]|uniref:hypothetical protein n=1 Tax=Nonomuraea antri TaxID=2730852 RepID=UPI00156A05B5|nr:hypothetical protein [Nonomuraea antri]NRQ36628.1 hypothetical protein [Nonomuraea antri]